MQIFQARPVRPWSKINQYAFLIYNSRRVTRSLPRDEGTTYSLSQVTIGDQFSIIVYKQ